MLGIVIGRAIPLSVGYAIANFVCRMIFLCDFKHRKRTIEHILMSGITSDYNVARDIALKSFVHLGKVAVEFVKLDQFFSKGDVNQYISYNISDEAKKALMDSRGTVCASAHYGNWEITGLSLSLIFRGIVSVGRELDNPKLSDYIFSKRKSYNQEICRQEGALKKLLIGLKQKKLLGLLTDQYPGDERGVRTTFFGKPTRSHDTPALLHLKTNAPLMLIVSRRLDDKFHFELIMRGPYHIEPTGDNQKDLVTLTQMINDDFEKIVRECPEQWLWAHRRWRKYNT